jgi:hypothetical protein
MSIIQKLTQSSIGQKADALLKKVPGLSGFLENQAEDIWEEGEEAIFNGELYLELYTEDELEGAAEIFAEALEIDTSEGTPSQTTDRLELNEKTAKVLFTKIDTYITNLFTSERLDRLRARLKAVANDPSYSQKWLPFRLMLTEYMADENAIENEKGFLIRALIGEMRVVEIIV